MTLGERIYRYRVEHDISQKALGKLCKVSGQTIWAIEKGDQEPSQFTIDKIELVIGKEGDDALHK